MTALNALSTVVLRGIEKEIEKELKSREALTPGDYTVDESVTLNVNGTLCKAADEEYTPTIKIAHKAAMALLVRTCGITGPAALKALESAMREALEADETSETYIQAMADLDAAEAKVTATLAKLPKAKRTGKTTIKVKVT